MRYFPAFQTPKSLTALPFGIEAGLIPNRRCATRPPAKLFPSLRLGRLGQSAGRRKPPRGPEPLFVQATGTLACSNYRNLCLFKPKAWQTVAGGRAAHHRYENANAPIPKGLQSLARILA